MRRLQVRGLDAATVVDVLAIGQSTQGLRGQATAAGEMGESLAGRWAGLPAVYLAPEAAALGRAMAPVAAATAELSVAVTAVASALETYAQEMAGLQAQQRSIAGEVKGLLREGMDTDDWWTDRQLVARQDALQNQADRLAGKVNDAELRCAAAIDSARCMASAGVPAASTATARQGKGALVTAARPGAWPAGSGSESSGELAKMSPEEVRVWWDSLSPRVQNAYVATMPVTIGGLDGLPGAVRDVANRSRLAGELERLLEQQAGLGFFTRNIGNRKLSDEINEKIDAIAAIQEVLDVGGRQLLLFDVSGTEAFAAISVGDVDAARNVGVIVGGTTTTVENGLATMDSKAYELKTLAVELGKMEREDVAVVAWLGYRAPDDLLDANGSKDARVGAPALASFLGGVAEGSDYTSQELNLTLGAHSYASRVASMAVNHDGTQVDSLVTYAGIAIEPSMPVDMNKYWLTNDNDPIRFARSNFPFQPVAKDGWVELHTTGRIVDGRALESGTGHDYLDENSMPQYNIAAIIANRPDLAVLYDGSY